MADYKPNFRMSLTAPSPGFGVAPSSIGDTSGSGVRYEFNLNEYPNDMALTRNWGPERAGGMVGGTGIKILKSSDRKTGRIGLAEPAQVVELVDRPLPALFLCPIEL